MLKPAVLYKEEIIKEIQKRYYTHDLICFTGSLDNCLPNILNEPERGIYQYAIVDQHDKLVGYISYKLDYYDSEVYAFQLISFDEGNWIIGRDLHCVMTDLLFNQHVHRIEWRAIDTCSIIRHYNKFIEEWNGNKSIMHDVFKDEYGHYHDEYIYEIINKFDN
jgi:hypothetical protein